LLKLSSELPICFGALVPESTFVGCVEGADSEPRAAPAQSTNANEIAANQ
jgi:hypothetical protein